MFGYLFKNNDCPEGKRSHPTSPKKYQKGPDSQKEIDGTTDTRRGEARRG
jgi:hypothetical protein